MVFEYLIARYTVIPAQRMEAASAEESWSGMGVTWVTHETTYCEKVPSTVKPLSFCFLQPAYAPAVSDEASNEA